MHSCYCGKGAMISRVHIKSWVIFVFGNLVKNENSMFNENENLEFRLKLKEFECVLGVVGKPSMRRI